MDTVTLGRTGLAVSAACLGCGGGSRIGQGRGATAAESVALVRAALDLGISIVDTAPAYGTEAIVGEALAGRRDGIVLSSKVMPAKARAGDSTDYLSPAELRASCEASLARLRTDRIDVFHLHAVKPQQYDHCETVLLPELLRLREAGKIRFLGLTESIANDPGHQVLQRALPTGHWDVAMVAMNLVNPSAATLVLPAAIAAGAGIMVMQAARGGISDPAQLRDLVARLVGQGEIDAGTVDADDPLGFLTAGGDAGSLVEAAYRFARHVPGVSVVMTGTGSIAHLAGNVRAIAGPPLRPAALERLAQIFGRVRSAGGERPA